MSMRPTVRRASTLVLALLVVALAYAPSASAAAFRYWTYWHAPSGAWAFATDGPAAHVPADGDVEGWRFAVTTQAGSSSQEPSVPATFASLCASTAPASGTKRVGLVIDPGPAAIAPAGQEPPAVVATCVQVPIDATGFDVLSKVAPVRTDGGLICSLAGYPTGECAPVLDDDEAQAIAQALAATPSASTASVAPVTTSVAAAATDTGSPVATIAVAVVLLVGAAIGAVTYRRRGRDG